MAEPLRYKKPDTYVDLPKDSGDEIDLGHLLSILWKNKLWIALSTITCICIGGYYAYFQAVPIYTATASIVLKKKSSSGGGIASLLAGADGLVPGLSGGSDTDLKTEMEIIRSRPFLASLVTDQKLLLDPEFNTSLQPDGALSSLKKLIVNTLLNNDGSTGPAKAEEVFHDTTDALSGALSLSEIRGTSIFLVSIKTEDPVKSASLTNALVKIYIDDRTKNKIEETEQTIQRLAIRVAELQEDLQGAETAVTSFNSQTDLISVEAFEVMNIQLKDLRSRLVDIGLKHQSADTLLLDLEEAKSTKDYLRVLTLVNDTGLDEAYAEIESGDIAAQRLFWKRLDAIFKQKRVELARITKQQTTLQTSSEQLEIKIDTQSEDLGKLLQLTREATANNVIYEYFLGRLKGTSVEQGLDLGTERVLSPAIVPNRPAGPRKSMILLFSGIVGLLLGSAAVLLYKGRGSGIQNGEELALTTGIPVLGQVSHYRGWNRQSVFKQIKDQKHSAQADSIRGLRTSLLLSDDNTNPQVIMLASSSKGEGKTTLSLALASSLASLEKKVLIIDGDLRDCACSTYFAKPNDSSVLSVLSGEVPFEDAVSNADGLGCDILIGEPSQLNAADILSSSKFKSLLETARQKYDIVIIDTPSVLQAPDARLIGKHVDSILYTVKSNSSTYDSLHEGIRLFEDANLKVSGLILNQIAKNK